MSACVLSGVGERTSHPELKQLLEEGVFKIHCYGAEKSFVPQITNKNSPPKEFKLDSGHIAWTVLDSTVCVYTILVHANQLETNFAIGDIQTSALSSVPFTC